ncbi:hypothetical protein GQ43DRAFT_299327 [Delitschia confertaspora ATCC 74209]|uniref:Stress-response A/B barrel domain-containing protein n=1 Tax=Delitschia confertaspora ATCC 74209 TaxID=1513339 RepID=A0A9P4N379_9PLEO|nr:hypothetical protein GQ43DRAFT_299327 [Delitschia confertaspora ATCC 74209]
MTEIVRYTLFKISDAAYIQEAVEKYSTLSERAEKSDEKYILHADAKPLIADPRSQGFTLIATTIFGTKADMDYYDNECTAHQEIKALLKGKVSEPPCVLYMKVETLDM